MPQPEPTPGVPVPIVAEAAALPRYAQQGDAGADLHAAEAVTLAAGGGRALVRTGVQVAIPDGYAGFVHARSGLAARHGVTCLNSPGVIDSGYRGEISVILVNTDPSTDYQVQPGDRIAQLVLQEVSQAAWQPVAELDDTERGSGGFGHTGLNGSLEHLRPASPTQPAEAATQTNTPPQRAAAT